MSLSREDRQEIVRKIQEGREEWDKKMADIRREELKRQGIIVDPNENKQENFHGDCDHPNTMENSTATIFYFLVMISGAIFNDRWLIWIVATVIYFRFITRHNK